VGVRAELAAGAAVCAASKGAGCFRSHVKAAVGANHVRLDEDDNVHRVM